MMRQIFSNRTSPPSSSSRATRRVAGADDREDESLEVDLVIGRKRTVDENVPALHRDERMARALAIAACSSFAEKWVALPFGFRMRTPSSVIPSTLSLLAGFCSRFAPCGSFPFDPARRMDFFMRENMIEGQARKRGSGLRLAPPQIRIGLNEPVRSDLEQAFVRDSRRGIRVSRLVEAFISLWQFRQGRLVEIEPRGGKADLLAHLHRGSSELQQVGRGGEAEVEIQQMRQALDRDAVQTPIVRLAANVAVDRPAPRKAGHVSSDRFPIPIG